jgi:carbonic anhydrase
MPFKKLIKGYKSFHRAYFNSGNDLYKNLVSEGQSPETLVIACSDSRTDPANVMNSQPGDLFVVRNVAAIVPPYKTDSMHHGTSAAIEFAVRTLKVKHIVVMGHSFCGGIEALAHIEDFKQNYEFLPQWVGIGAPALETVQLELQDADPAVRRRALEQAVILVSLKNLMSFPWIREGVEQEKIQLHGWYLDISDGKLLSYDPVTEEFCDIHGAGTKHVL